MKTTFKALLILLFALLPLRFCAASETVTAAGIGTFGRGTVIDIGGILDDAANPPMGRTLLLNRQYYSALAKDSSIKVIKSVNLPATAIGAQTLKGFGFTKSALCLGTRLGADYIRQMGEAANGTLQVITTPRRLQRAPMPLRRQQTGRRLPAPRIDLRCEPGPGPRWRSAHRRLIVRSFPQHLSGQPRNTERGIAALCLPDLCIWRAIYHQGIPFRVRIDAPPGATLSTPAQSQTHEHENTL